jgi:drug/metabolite transporter (DMT)-like permease
MTAGATALDPAALRRRHLTGIILIVLSTVAWGSGGLFVRLLPYDIWTIVFWRGVFGTLFVGSYVLYRFGRTTPLVILRMGRAGVVITACTVATIILMVSAFQHTSVANAMTIYAALPFFTAAIAWVWLRERPSVATIVASCIVMLGVFIMLGPSTGGPRSGDLLAAVATFTTGVMAVAIRRAQGVEMLPVAGLATILSALIALPLAQHIGDFTPRDYLVAAGFGLGPMTLGMMLFIIGSAMIPAPLSALISTMEAPIGALWAWVGVGEAPAVTTIIGGGIVLGGVIGRLLLERKAEAAKAE